ncbi:hypothetical protein BCR37DRAFT_378837 [Protomyces lactucae-debilis]|uniref:CCHC-type domain-containing protein n=1 Tax=Protomyces lactucae-debilis TaxID=2754530 RepID=A0A1Y2FKU4_PROLT|nr:uncharacterized protein BCR37DRAFT_378837 [Protomyces lactucae-debilis]ORY83826.1 hypothetical protein BCR37DRAFT_378837 [Protomyces lactucae-debilis]
MSFNLLAKPAEEPAVALPAAALSEGGEEEVLFTVDVDKHEENDTHEARQPINDAAGPAKQATSEAEKAGDSESDAEDAEDWADISKGRYFGDPNEATDAQRCHNCKGIGHKRKDCPHSLCRTCGALDDHDTVRCPLTQRCFNCARLGHLASACPEPQRQSGSHCKECGSRSHLARSCPQIWRLYHPDVHFNADSTDWSVTPYCYNCADQGHYGDDCDLPHRTRLLEPSAFCLANEPESTKPRATQHQKQRSRGSVPQAPAAHYTETSKGSAHGSSRGNERRYTPYQRPEVVSERYPRGAPGYGSGSGGGRGRDSGGRGSDRGYGRERDSYDDRGGRQQSRGGKPYRGGMFAKNRRR